VASVRGTGAGAVDSRIESRFGWKALSASLTQTNRRSVFSTGGGVFIGESILVVDVCLLAGGIRGAFSSDTPPVDWLSLAWSDLGSSLGSGCGEMGRSGRASTSVWMNL
jgi:hypothetical protein